MIRAGILIGGIALIALTGGMAAEEKKDRKSVV